MHCIMNRGRSLTVCNFNSASPAQCSARAAGCSLTAGMCSLEHMPINGNINANANANANGK